MCKCHVTEVINEETGGMAQSLGALATLPKGLGLVGSSCLSLSPAPGDAASSMCTRQASDADTKCKQNSDTHDMINEVAKVGFVHSFCLCDRC